LITTDNGKSHATHIPIELVKNAKEEWILQGHIAKANSQWKHFNNGQDVLAIFNGPHSYVSSSWYDYEEVPTWNYVAVHIRGTIKIVEGEALYQALKHLVDKYEADSKHPISVDNLSKKTMRQVNGIVGFEIQIKDIQAAYKLSQGHNDENYKAVSEQLSQCPSAAAKEIADLMNSKRKLSK
jgi:transcriptional regulator